MVQILYEHETHMGSCLVFNMESSASTDRPPGWSLVTCSLFVLGVFLEWLFACLSMSPDDADA